MTAPGMEHPTPYDFRKPSRLPDGLDQYLACYQKSLCSRLPEKWNVHLASPLQWIPSTSETLRSADAVAQLPDPALSFSFALGEVEVPTVFSFPRQLMLALVSGMLGDIPEELPADRELTVVEHSLAGLAMQELVVALRESSPQNDALACRLQGAIPRRQIPRLFPVGEDIVNCRIKMNGLCGTHDVHWLLPQEASESLIEREDWQTKADPSVGPRLESLVRDIPVQVVVRLGGATLHVSDLANLRAGDVVLLDQRVAEPLVAVVADEQKFRGWAGRVGTRQAFQIASIVQT